MPANRRTVGPKVGGGWEITGGPAPTVVPTQDNGIAEAKRQLHETGGGELVIKGRDGRIRAQNTIGRPDPRRSKG